MRYSRNLLRITFQGRQLVLKAITASLLVHAVVLSAAGLAWTRPVREFALAGQRRVVQIELSLSEPSPVEPIQMTIVEQPLPRPEEPAPPLEPAPPDASSEMPAPEVAARHLPTSRLEAALLARSQPQRELLDEEISPPKEQRADREPTPPRAVAAQPVPDQPDTPVKLERPMHQRPLSQPLVAVPQIAGNDEREPPDFAGNRPPAYPLEAIRRQWEGTVLLRLRIADSGRVEGVEIVKSSGHAILDRSAVAAVLSWQGRPARQGGQPVATEEVLPVRFRL